MRPAVNIPPVAGYLYILECADGSHYTGSTTDPDLRLSEHQLGVASAYTRCRLPVTLVYSCEFSTYYAAFERERQIKNWSHSKKEALIRGDFDLLKRLSRGGRPLR